MKIDSKKPQSIKIFSPLTTWIVCFTVPKIIPHAVAYIRSVIYQFFVLQFLRKLKLIRTPILNVETPLDQKVPFAPQHIFDYLEFVDFWLRPLAMLAKVLGIRKAAPLIAKFLMTLKRTYNYAAQIYKFCMTTTNRPLYKKRTRFIIMRMVDPHYLCVPSLHVAIVALCYAYFKNVLKSKDFSNEQRELWTHELYEGAIKIAETVLYVKQHSVNCIPAALYIMTKIIPQKFSSQDAKDFLDSMFTTRIEIDSQNRTEIVEYMKNLFSQLYEQGKTARNLDEPIKNWMIEYAKKTSQKTVTKKLILRSPLE